MVCAIVCSDQRMCYVSKYIASCCDLIICDETVDFLSLPPLDFLILPVKGIDVDGNLNIQGKCVHVPTKFWELQKEVGIITGLPTPYIASLPHQKFYYMLDEQVVKENAVLTAEGVLQLLISSIDQSLYDITVDVIGYGNCGKAIVNMLQNLDVSVRVIRRACEEKGPFITIEHWEQCADVIINTSIQQVLCAKRLKLWEKKPLVIDIATPDVVDVEETKRLQIPYIKAPNLPGRFCADSAGRIIACYIRGIVHGE